MADTSMYGMIKPIDVMGSVEGGMRMRDLIDERKRKSAIQGAYKQGMQTGPDGKVAFDHSKTASALAQGGYGQEAYEAQQQGVGDQQKQMEMAVKNAQYGAQVLGAARNQDEWNAGLQQLQNNGIPADKLPAQFSPENQKFLVDSAMTLGDRLNEQWKEKSHQLEWAKLGQGKKELTDKEKELNATQAKQLGLYNIGREAESQYQSAVSDPNEYDPTAVGQIFDNDNTGWVPNWMKSNKAIESQAAQANWVESFLRDASGAAIPASERGAYAKDFFPQPGDTPAVIANKEAMRKSKMENSLIGAGSAGKQIMAQGNYFPKSQRKEKNSSMGVDKANASSAPKILKTNQIDWAD